MLPSFLLRPPPELKWKRKDLLKLLQARTGKGDFKAYHLMRKHDSAILNCHLFSEETSRVHPFLCPGLAPKQRPYLQSPARYLTPKKAL